MNTMNKIRKMRKKKYYRDCDGCIWVSDGKLFYYTDNVSEPWLGGFIWSDNLIERWGLEELNKGEVFLEFI